MAAMALQSESPSDVAEDELVSGNGTASVQKVEERPDPKPPPVRCGEWKPVGVKDGKSRPEPKPPPGAAKRRKHAKQQGMLEFMPVRGQTARFPDCSRACETAERAETERNFMFS
jgi:hypothetical protein